MPSKFGEAKIYRNEEKEVIPILVEPSLLSKGLGSGILGDVMNRRIHGEERQTDGYLPTLVAGENLLTEAIGGPSTGLKTVSTIPTIYAEFTIKALLFPGSWTQNSIDIQFNGDTGSNYAYRFSKNGAADTTANTVSRIRLVDAIVGDGVDVIYVVMTVSNRLDQEKNVIFEVNTNNNGAANSPNSYVGMGKWVNTTANIISISFILGGADTFGANSRITLYRN